MTKILFQGDSITDCLRNRDTDNSLGQGYALMVAGQLGYRYPGQYECINRAVSGNRIVDLYARWKADCWNLQPDVISILVGVNDVWHEFGSQNGVDAKRFFAIYDLLLSETRERLPDCRFILLEPFALPGTATELHGFAAFSEEVALRAEAVRRLAEKHSCVFIPLQESFTLLSQQALPAHWLGDGVHPTPAGHAMLAEKWMDAWQSQPE